MGGDPDKGRVDSQAHTVEAEGGVDSLLRRLARAPDSTPAEALIGTTLGRYQVRALLGRGGMGIVYRATDTALGRDVALKVLPAEVIEDRDRRSRFLREARSGAAATHSNIAAIYDVGEADGVVYIAMEYVVGRTLRALVQAGPLAADRVARIATAIARGLAAAHEAGIIHRDLKPDNVMITDGGDLKILDFGLAKLRGAAAESGTDDTSVATRAGSITGTPAYMSPEQAKGRTVDERSDLFSLGVMLYEMLAGKRPFQGTTTMEVIIAVDRDEPPPLPSLAPETPPALVEIVARCLQKDPAARYPNARALSMALEENAPREAVTKPEIAKPARRRSSWATVALLLVLLLAVGAAWQIHRMRRSPLAAPDTNFACAIFETSGIEQPGGWLGAAAAVDACEGATLLTGGNRERMVMPAMLLELPRQPVDDFPREPFDRPHARARSLEAAKKSAAYLDGKVEVRARDFAVSVRLHRPDGSLVAEGRGEAATVHRATARALDGIVGPHAIPRAPRIDPAVAAWAGFDDIDLARELRELERDLGDTIDEPDSLEYVKAHKAQLGPRWPIVEAMLSLARKAPHKDLEPPPLDRSSPARFVHSVIANVMIKRPPNLAALADELRALTDRETSPVGRSTLLLAEGVLRSISGDDERCRTIALARLAEGPSGDAWSQAMQASFRRPGFASIVRGAAAWNPEQTMPLQWSAFDGGPAERVKVTRRAHLLAPQALFAAANFAHALLNAGATEEARALAGKLSTGTPAQRDVSDLIFTQVEGALGHVRGALERAQRVVRRQPIWGREINSDTLLTILSLELADVLGEAEPWADELFHAFIEPEPPKLHPFNKGVFALGSICAMASPAISQRCAQRIDGLLKASYFALVADNYKAFFAGVTPYTRKDFRGAANAWRTIVGDPSFPRTLVANAFDRIGEPDTADRVDATPLTMALSFNGVTLAHVRRARRALDRGDKTAARELAQKVIDAWSVADAEIPAVAEMRALLKRAR